MAKKLSYKDWFIPFAQDWLTLREARASLSRLGAKQKEIPLIIQLVENPKYHMPGFRIFHGAVDIEQHDYIHIVLGRGLLPKDEAFAIGFTMGVSKGMTTFEEKLFAFCSKHLYPGVYKFKEAEIKIFKDAVRLGFISDCAPLDEWNFKPFLDTPIKEVRQALGLEPELILAYYTVEQHRYPRAIESQRLLKDSNPVV